MKNFKKYFLTKSCMLLVVMLLGVLIGSSCSKDDNSDQPDNPASSNELVGTWYFTYQGETDYDDYFIFKSNGTGTYHYDDAESDDFTYTYDSKTKLLCLNYKHWESERFTIEWLGKNLVDFEGYGEYLRK